MNKNTKSKAMRRVLAVLLAVVLVCGGAFGLYVGDYYRADETALAVSGTVNGSFTSLPGAGEVGLIFYPGGKVQAESYLPLLAELADAGVTCVLAEMPFNLAFFGRNKAEQARALHPEVERWYLAGHSLGGAMACSHMTSNQDAYEGIVLLGAYVYGDIPADKALVLYGSEDQVLSRDKLTGGDNEIVIEGGNHAQFGCYGPQDGDGTAAISAQEQRRITAAYTLEFMGLAA